MRSRLTVALALALVSLTLVVGPAGTSDATGYTRKQLFERAKKLELRTSLAAFLKVRASHSGIDDSYTWSTDGCSIPYWTWKWGDKTRKFFYKSCVRHDFGYRNFGHGLLRLRPNDRWKGYIDSQLHRDMIAQCDADPWTGCKSSASAIYTAVRDSGQAKAAYYSKDVCPKGKLCLWDDRGYGDTRKDFTSSENNMDDVGFGDKTSSAYNHSGVAWVLYDDHDYSDTAWCLKPGASVSDLDVQGFGDKTSSAKRRADTSCPLSAGVIK